MSETVFQGYFHAQPPILHGFHCLMNKSFFLCTSVVAFSPDGKYNIFKDRKEYGDGYVWKYKWMRKYLEFTINHVHNFYKLSPYLELQRQNKLKVNGCRPLYSVLYATVPLLYSSCELPSFMSSRHWNCCIFFRKKKVWLQHSRLMLGLNQKKLNFLKLLKLHESIFLY